MARPVDWNSSHAVTLNLTNTDMLHGIAAGGSSVSAGTVSFANSNSVTFGLDGSSMTMSVGDRESVHAVAFGGFGLGNREIGTGKVQRSTTTRTVTWSASPAYLSAPKAISEVLMTVGVSWSTTNGMAQAAGSRSYGIYTSSAGTLSTVWSTSLEWIVDYGTAFTLLIGAGGLYFSTNPNTTTGSRWFNVRASIGTIWNRTKGRLAIQCIPFSP